MADTHRSAEKFLVCRYDYADRDNEFVDVTEHDSCVEALELARSWYAELSDCRDVEVWVGPYNIFDSCSDDLDLYDRSIAPRAPGRYGYEWNADGSDYRWWPAEGICSRAPAVNSPLRRTASSRV